MLIPGRDRRFPRCASRSGRGSQIVNVAPPSLIVAHRQPARLFLEELGRQIQPVAGAVVPRREERLEDAIDEGFGDSRAIVDDIDDDPVLPLVFRRAGP